MGIKKHKDDGSDAVEKLVQLASDVDNLPLITDLKTEHYVLPEQEKNVDLFKGAVFNLGELKRQLAMSKSMDFLFERSSLDSREKTSFVTVKCRTGRFNWRQWSYKRIH